MFILRDMNVKQIDSCVTNNAHIYCDKDTYDVSKDMNQPSFISLKIYLHVF